MRTLKNYRWRMTSDVNREHALFELLDGKASVLDVGYTDEGSFEISFGPGIVSTTIKMDDFFELINEGKLLADRERNNL